MGDFINIINQVLYFAYDTFDKILQSFGLRWLQLVTGLAVVSVILRLFAGNLVGTAMHIRHQRQEASAQQRIERQKSKAAAGRGASTSSRKD